MSTATNYTPSSARQIPSSVVLRRERRLRVGVLVDALTLPRWCEQVLRDVQASGYGEVVLVIVNQAPPPPAPRTSRLERLWRNREHLLYALYTKIDQRLFRQSRDPFTETSIEPLVREVPILHVVPRQTKHCDYLDAADAERIRGYELDVVIRFGFRILKGEVLEVARYGVWSYHHGDNLVNRGGPAGFWEVMEGTPVTGSILQILTEELDAGRVIYRSYASTDQRSVTRNKHNYYWKSAAFLPRKLRELHQEGPEALCDRSTRPDTYPTYSYRLYTTPTNRELFPILLRRLGRSLRARLTSQLSFEQWFLAYSLSPRDSHPDSHPLDVPHQTFHRFKAIVPPRDRLWADPFPVVKDGRYYVFIEELVYATSKGHISVIEITPDGEWKPPVMVLERAYHLSYPFIFTWQGQHYMVPETYDHRTVELYRAVEFPHHWELDRVLLENVRAVDATLAELNGRWWMFVNMAEADDISASEELHLYYADSPLGPWHPHHRNPVKSDVRSARPAGRIFHWHGSHYRPSQDCSSSYGYAIVINRIRHLDLDEYEEEEIAKLLPQWYPGLTGTHTLNAAGDLTVVDAKMRRWRF